MAISDWKIREGDKVNVYFEYSECIIGATVRYMPQATGDSWILETSDSIIYVQTFSKMTKRKENDGIPF